jgi:hypothetical protein
VEKPFPRRTILLMVLALMVFARFFWMTRADRAAAGLPEVRLVPLDGGIAQ